ncbi:MAG: hypothetical protein CVU27_10215 [Betaproteobacteria bacterium HGW-Betaproteobacteria-20]|jgi:hypothetical protein|nr:MAG: hypothetical protein CVU27_10215 [Betaproteobacteria bacterium HGW-Betaproteobacteria-20]
MKLLAFLMMLFPVVCSAANAEYLKIYMMQPKNVILDKMDGVDDMDRYVKEIEVNINKKLSEITTASTSWGFLVIAVRDDGKIKAWLDTDDAVPPAVANAMVAVAENTKAFPVKSGAAVFSLGFGVDGAALPIDKMPFPNEWKKIAQCTNEDCAEHDAEAIVLKSWN